MPRLRLRIHPTGHLEVEVEGMTDDGCHALVDEAASGVGVILERRAAAARSLSRRRRQARRRPSSRGLSHPHRLTPISRMSPTERYRIEPDGTVVTVYTDTVDLRALGHVQAVERASSSGTSRSGMDRADPGKRRDARPLRHPGRGRRGRAERTGHASRGRRGRRSPLGSPAASRPRRFRTAAKPCLLARAERERELAAERL